LTDPVLETDWAFVLEGDQERVNLNLERYSAEGRRIEAWAQKTKKAHEKEWRALADKLVGRNRNGELSDLPGTFRDPLWTVLGVAAHSTDDEDDIVASLLDIIKERVNASRQVSYDENWLRECLHGFREKDEAETTSAQNDLRPVIQIKDGALPEITDKVHGLVTRLYQREGKIVRPGTIKIHDRGSKEIFYRFGIDTLNGTQLRRHVMKQIRFEKYNATKKLWFLLTIRWTT
jgi:hypothetical protein